jgi:glycosyltransferase involved in cell wall biosynthesis
MKIGLDLRMAYGGSGIGRYISELAEKILERDKENSYVLFFNDPSEEFMSRFKKFGQKIVISRIPHYSLIEQIKLPFVLLGEKLDLVHFPHFNVPLLYRKPFVVTIHDLTHTRFPGRKMSHFFYRIAYNLILLNALRASRAIIAVSSSTRQELKEFFGQKVFDKSKVVYEGLGGNIKIMDKNEAMNEAKKRFGIGRPFLLYVGVLRRYKNIPNLAEAFNQLTIELNLDLVLAGAEDPFYPEIRQKALQSKHSDRIRFLGKVSDQDLQLLYNAATLFVLPSQYEGFGLTALEAASCGLPVCCSDIPTTREILGQAAEYFDPQNPDNIADVIRALIKNKTRMDELSNVGIRRSRDFSWDKAAQETIKLYEEAVK